MHKIGGYFCDKLHKIGKLVIFLLEKTAKSFVSLQSFLHFILLKFLTSNYLKIDFNLFKFLFIFPFLTIKL